MTAFFSLYQPLLPWFLAVNIFTLSNMLYIKLKANATRKWQPVSGTMLESKVTAHKLKSGKVVKSEKAVLQYSYKVGAKTYQCSAVSLGEAISDTRYAEKLVARYPKGSKVTVFYYPGNPAKAVLEKEPAILGQLLSWLLIANFVLLVGGPLFILSRNWSLFK